MPRRGQNPQRWAAPLDEPPPMTATVLVHIPSLDGYWSESLDVLRLCLDSLGRTLPENAEVVVLDNASCAEVRDELRQRQDAEEIDQLLLSRHNLGKVGGWNLLFAAARGESVAYCDSDVFFLPGWWEATAAILGAFPEAAMVTAQPIPGDLSLHCDATLAGAAASADVELEEGDDLIPSSYVESHRMGLGETPEKYADRIAQRREVRLRRNAGGTQVEAYVSASHFQFVLRRSAIEKFFPLPTSIPLGDDAAFDALLDETGAWRLSTVDYLVHHLGNEVPDLAAELPWADSTVLAQFGAAPRAQPRRTGGWSHWAAYWAAQRGPVRKLLKTAHRWTFDLLYPN